MTKKKNQKKKIKELEAEIKELKELKGEIKYLKWELTS